MGTEEIREVEGLSGKDVSIQLMSPASGDPSILNPYPARCPETVSEGQEKSSKTTNRQQEKNSQNPYPASDRSSQPKNQYYSHFTWPSENKQDQQKYTK